MSLTDLARTIDTRCLQKLAGDRLCGVGPDQIEAERTDERGDDDRPGPVREPDRTEHQERRDRKRGSGDRDSTQNDREHRLLAWEVEVGKSVAGQGREDRRPTGTDLEQYAG